MQNAPLHGDRPRLGGRTAAIITIPLTLALVIGVTGCTEPAPSEIPGTSQTEVATADEPSPTDPTTNTTSTSESTPTSAVDDRITQVDFGTMSHTYYVPHFEGISPQTIDLVDGVGHPKSTTYDVEVTSTQAVGYADLDSDGDLDAIVEFDGTRTRDYGDSVDEAPLRQYTAWFWNADTGAPEQVEGEVWLAGNGWAIPGQSLGGVCRLSLAPTVDGRGGELTMQFGTPNNEHANNLVSFDCPDDRTDLNGGYAITIVADPDTHEVTRAPWEGGGFAGASPFPYNSQALLIEGAEAQDFADSLGTRMTYDDGTWVITRPIDTGGDPITALRAPSLDAARGGDNGARATYTTHELGAEAPPDAWSWAYFAPGQ